MRNFIFSRKSFLLVTVLSVFFTLVSVLAPINAEAAYLNVPYFNGSYSSASWIACTAGSPQLAVQWNDVPTAVTYRIDGTNVGVGWYIDTTPTLASSNSYNIVARDASNFVVDSWTHINNTYVYPAPCNAFINVNESGGSGGTWTITPDNISNSASNEVFPDPTTGGSTYTLTVNSLPTSRVLTSIVNSKGGSTTGNSLSMHVNTGESPDFTINYAPAPVNTIPTIDTPISSSITTSSATLGATVRTLGVPATLTGRGVCYSTSSNPSLINGANCVSAALSQAIPGSFTINASSLAANTLYHFRGYASNSFGTGYTADTTFTTLAVPPPVNQPPVAVAGPDKSIQLPTSSSAPTGTSATDSDGTISSTVWSYVSCAGVCGATPSITSGNTLNPTFSNMTNVGVYTFRLTVTDNNGAFGTDDMTVTVAAAVAGTIPTVDTPTSLAGATTTATLGATVRTLGTPIPLLDRGVCYSTSINPSLTNGATCASAVLSQVVPGIFTVNVSSLTPSTTYHFRGYATNATGTGYTSDTSFVTGTVSPPPMSGTLSPASPSCAINAGSSTCNINYTWTTTNPVATSSVTSNTNNTGAASPNFLVASGNSGGPAAFAVPYNTRTFFLYNNGTQLASSTVTSSCTGGSTWNGSICAANAMPTADTPTSGSLTPSTAVIGATVRTIGSPAPLLARGVCYSSTTVNPSLSNGATCITATLSQTAPSAFTVNLSSLTASTTYNFRGYASNSTGTGYTANTTFTTAPPSAMSGTLLPASSSCTISVGVGSCVSGTLTWTTASPVSTSAITNNGTATLSTGGPLNTLNGSATFTVPYNSALGGVTSFFLFNNSQQLAVSTVTTTCAGGSSWNGSICAANAVPTVISPTATGMTTTGATLGANITSAGVPATITARGTCWGANPAPVTNCVAEGGTTTGVFTQARTGMTAGTTYYYRGYATNSTGTGYSADAQFTTTSAAGMTGNLSAPNCTIALSASTCTTTLTWSVSNPEVALGSNVTSNTNNSGAASPNFVIAPPVTTGNADAGTKTLVIIPFGSRTFFLNNNAKSLVPTSPSGGGITVTATCASGSWNGTTCSNVQPAPSVTLVANPLAVATAGMTSSLSWTTSNLANPDYCTSNFFAGNRLVSNLTPVVVTPVAPSSTYTIQCFRLSDSTSTPVSSQVVTVGAGTKKPIFIEN